MKNDLDKQIDDKLEQLRREYPVAGEAHIELLVDLDMGNIDPIDAALDLSRSLCREDLVALYQNVRRYFHADRIDPMYAEYWLQAYSVISDVIDPENAEVREWTVGLDQTQAALFEELANRSE
jgi:hypothetical protein